MNYKFTFLIFFLGVGLVGCKSNHENSCSVPAQAHGFSYSPLGFPNDFNQSVAFFEDMERLNDSSVLWKGNWRDTGAQPGEVPEGATLIQDSAIQYCFVPINVFTWRTDTTNEIAIPTSVVNDWTNVEARSKYIAMLVKFVTKYRPPYVFLGNENDFYYESNVADYAHWLIVYNAAYDAIKQVSESTKVGPVFSFEHMTGQGLLVGWNTSYWEALDAHDLDKIDVIGLTVYPFFNYGDPADIPSNYIDPLIARIGSRPIVITETGWPAQNFGNLNPQWSTTEENQVEYISRLKAFTSGENVPVMNWLYFNAMMDDGTESEAWKTFGSIALKNQQGIVYQAYDSWTDL